MLTNTDIKKILNDVVVHMPADNTIMAAWSGVVYDTSNAMVRVDKLFLNVVYRYRNCWRFRRCAGVLQMTKWGRQLTYMLKNTYRVTSGERCGFVVLREDLRSDESYVPTGLQKQMVVGNHPECFWASRSNDRGAAALLAQLATTLKDDIVDIDDIEVMEPFLYQTVQKNKTRNPCMRRTKEALDYIHSLGTYDDMLSASENDREMINAAAVDIGNGRIALPFRFFDDRGVVAADPYKHMSVRGLWHRLRTLNYEQVHIKLQGWPL